MGKLKLNGKDIIALGYQQGKAVGVAIHVMTQQMKKMKKGEVYDLLKAILQDPDAYVGQPPLDRIAAELIAVRDAQKVHQLTPPREFPVYGAENIEEGAFEQMRIAMRLPVTVAGALMPDAHQGYGLPIGGVLAVDNAVIPYAVGVDIGCRMCLSVFPIDSAFMQNNRERLAKMLQANTRFGFDQFEDPLRDDAFFEKPELDLVYFVKNLKSKAYAQIGSSGSGNHFVEFGETEIKDADNPFGLAPGRYLSLLSHSGSRGFGATIAGHYTKLAAELCKLPQEARHLAWLPLDSEAGMEYWLAMNLAGDYASACHHHIHRRIALALGEQPLAMVENHHNFAWKEQLADGREVIVHRKGATPAKEGELGIIPGSMTAPAFIVRGKGNQNSLQSASHGAGRRMSRTKAMATFTAKMMKDHLLEQRVELIGGGLDESPFAYKDIREVMKHQRDLVDVLGTFQPTIVRMAAPEKNRRDKE